MWVVVKIMVPFLDTLNNRCRIILRTQKGTLILRATHVRYCKVLRGSGSFESGAHGLLFVSCGPFGFKKNFRV